MSKRYNDLIEEYVEKFGEVFPEKMASTDPDENMKIMENCIRSGKPFDPYSQKDFDPDADY